MKLQDLLEKKLREHFQPILLKVINESPQHSVPANSESHFRVILVSDKFEGVSLVNRHQMIYKVVSEELKNKIHAFSQQVLTPEEWTQKGGQLPASPPCAKK
ncbi:MAG: BolA family protein [Bdellovibrionales bacterium]